MSVFHASFHHASSTERGARALQRLVEQVSALGVRPMAQEGFEGFEREAHELFAEAEREVLGEALERLESSIGLLLFQSKFPAFQISIQHTETRQ